MVQDLSKATGHSSANSNATKEKFSGGNVVGKKQIPTNELLQILDADQKASYK